MLTHHRRLSHSIVLLLMLPAFAPLRGIAMSLDLTQRIQAKDSLLDSFDSVSSWSTNPSGGVEASVHSDAGLHGRAMRIDFDFHGHKGYTIVHRDLDLQLPANYQLSVNLRGDAPSNTLELKLVDRDRASVWWSNNPEFVFPREWQTLIRKKHEICFAWGQMSRLGDTRHLAAIEFAITAGSGGKGSVWLDDLTLTPLERESPFDVTPTLASNPLVGTWETAVPNPDGTGAKLDFAADGSFRSTVGIMAPFNYSVDKDNLTTEFHAGKSREYRFTNHFAITNGTLTLKGDNLLGRDVTMKQLGPPHSDDSILGAWTMDDFTGAISYVAFEENGKAEFRIPQQYCAGIWKEAGARLSVVMNGQLAERELSIERDTLRLMYQGREVRYTRRRVTTPLAQ